MDGPAIFHFALHKIKDFLKETLQRRSLAISDFDMVLFHQANRTMVDLLYKGLDVPPDKRYYFLERAWATAAAPRLPRCWPRRGGRQKVKAGTRTLMCSFGGGLSWGVVSLRWPADADASVPGEVDVSPDPRRGEKRWDVSTATYS